MDADELIKKRHDQSGVYDCDLTWSEHGRASARADLYYFKPSVAAIFRMDIGIWHQDDFGDRRRTLTRNLRNLSSQRPGRSPNRSLPESLLNSGTLFVTVVYDLLSVSPQYYGPGSLSVKAATLCAGGLGPRLPFVYAYSISNSYV